MGKYIFKLPDVGEGTAEAEIAAWHVAVGDTIAEDAPLVDVMTDKATVEIPSPIAGKVVSITGTPGEMAAVGSELVVFEVEGAGNAQAETAAKPAPAAKTAPPPKAAPEPKPAPAPVAAAAAPAPVERTHAASEPAFATRTPGEKPQASPAVRGKARELGIELQFVPGSGPGGRIGQDDLDAYVASRGRLSKPGGAVERHGVEQVKIIGLRRKIAEKMQETKRRIPHYSYIEEIDVTSLEELRQHLNIQKADRPKLTILPFLMQALVKALPHYPQINARFDDDAGIVERHEAIHLGIATQTPGGLLVPVVRHAEALDIWDYATEVSRLAAAARDGKASREELSGSTITITSLGALGGLATTPVINHPEVAIVGVNKIVERPMVKGGQVAIRKMMNLSSSFDHRVVDGWDAAEFIQRIRGLLEQPATLFMD